MIECSATEVADAQRAALRRGEHQRLGKLAGDVSGQLVDKESVDGTSRRSCPFGAPRTSLRPPTSVTDSGDGCSAAYEVEPTDSQSGQLAEADAGVGEEQDSKPVVAAGVCQVIDLLVGEVHVLGSDDSRQRDSVGRRVDSSKMPAWVVSLTHLGMPAWDASGMELTLAQRKAITKAQLARWPKASKSEKSAILDAVCQVTGWHRDHARKAIRVALADQVRGGPVPRPARRPVVVYGQDAVALLTRCWAVLDGPSGKRLRPALAEVLANLGLHGHLTGVDPAVDRDQPR